jgi:hypothetical protein
MMKTFEGQEISRARQLEMVGKVLGKGRHFCRNRDKADFSEQKADES